MPAYHRPLLAASVAVAFVLAACSSSSGGTASSAPATSSSPSASPVTSTAASALNSGPTPTPASSPAALLAKVALSKKDLATGYAVKLESGGNKVTGQATLDNCGYDFTTEGHRVARLQLDVLSPQHQDTGISNEVVAYDTAADAKLALTQFRASMRVCHRDVYWTPKDAGSPPLRYLSFGSAPVKGLPAVSNDVASFVATAKGSTKKLYLTEILQTKGTLLDAIYFESPTKPLSAELTAVSTLAVLSGQRLVAL
jgi:hypothetical protein